MGRSMAFFFERGVAGYGFGLIFQGNRHFPSRSGACFCFGVFFHRSTPKKGGRTTHSSGLLCYAGIVRLLGYIRESKINS